jgi:hypothetical protein
LSQNIDNPNILKALSILIQEALSVDLPEPGRTLTVMNSQIMGVQVGDWEITTRRIRKPS